MNSAPALPIFLILFLISLWATNTLLIKILFGGWVLFITLLITGFCNIFYKSRKKYYGLILLIYTFATLLVVYFSYRSDKEVIKFRNNIGYIITYSLNRIYLTLIILLVVIIIFILFYNIIKLLTKLKIEKELRIKDKDIFEKKINAILEKQKAEFELAELKKKEYLELKTSLDTRIKENQLRFITDDGVVLKKENPINKEVFKNVFEPIDLYMKVHYKNYRLIAETTLGAFIKAKCSYKDKEERAKASINSKRIDFLIIDPFGKPALAIEYHGTGHWINNVKEKGEQVEEKEIDIKLNDKVKAKALELADIKLIVIENDQYETIKQGLEEVRKYLKYYDITKKSKGKF